MKKNRIATPELNESDFLTIFEALEKLQKETLGQLRDGFDDIRQQDVEHYEAQPARIARLLRKLDSAYDQLN